MQYLLSKASHPILVRLANEQTLCAFDFDGTLAPIAAHPDQARLRPHTRALLGNLALLYPRVILSGRAREDLLQQLAGVRLQHIIGNHGAETGGAVKKASPEVKTWKTAIEPLLSALPGQNPSPVGAVPTQSCVQSSRPAVGFTALFAVQCLHSPLHRPLARNILALTRSPMEHK